MRQYNLSITNTYQILDSYYTGEGNGTICQNCGRYITNVAIIKSSKGVSYCVGMDCAETLSGISNDFTFEYVHKANFNTAKQIYSALKRLIKKANEKGISYSILYKKDHCRKDGDIVGGAEFHTVPFDVYLQWWKYVPAEVFNKYVFPMISKLDIKEKQC
jgi:hypothetical protein